MNDHQSIISDDKIRTGELTHKAWTHFGQGYIKLTQVRAATGWHDPNTADLMVLGDWPSTGGGLSGIEVKISRADWLNEIKNPRKNDGVKRFCRYWWLVISDASMVKDDELPDDWGMMVWNGPGKKLKVIKQAPEMTPEPMDPLFVASLLRHNEKEQIPIDIHNDKLKDAKFEAHDLAKKKSDDLYKFASALSANFGVQIKQVKESNYNKPKAPREYVKWIAEMKNTWIGSMDVETLIRRFELVNQYESMISHVKYANDKLPNILREMPKEDSSAKIWLEWAQKDVNKILKGDINAEN